MFKGLWPRASLPGAKLKREQPTDLAEWCFQIKVPFERAKSELATIQSFY